MANKRIKVSGAFNDFTKKIKALKKFDSNNQTNFQNGSLSKKQLEILTESSFFNAFREYENYIRDVFLLYTQEKNRIDGTSVDSYINPKDFNHAEMILKSSMNFLDWNTPDTIIERADIYLKNGYPIKDAYTANKVILTDYKKLRNHIAHNSSESLKAYKKVLRKHYGTIPLQTPNSGEYLLLTSRNDNTKYYLLEFFHTIENLAEITK